MDRDKAEINVSTDNESKAMVQGHLCQCGPRQSCSLISTPLLAQPLDRANTASTLTEPSPRESDTWAEPGAEVKILLGQHPSPPPCPLSESSLTPVPLSGSAEHALKIDTWSYTNNSLCRNSGCLLVGDKGPFQA